MNESKLIEVCQELLSFEENEQYNFQYANLPLCVIDSVFSIGVKYENVENVIKKVSNFLNIEKYASDKGLPKVSEQVSISKFLDRIKEFSAEDLAKNAFNFQRTSTKNGILKAEACVQFMQVLLKHNVNYLQDLPLAFSNFELEKNIKNIKGQGSGISLKYFYILGGLEDLIKPDRMIMTFLREQTGENYSMDEAQNILLKVAQGLSKTFNRKITAAFLDNKIWLYQREKK